MAAKNEAASLPRLINEITWGIAPVLCNSNPGGLNGYEVIVVDHASTDSTEWVANQLAAVIAELGEVQAGNCCGPRRRRWLGFGPQEVIGSPRSMRTCRTTRPTCTALECTTRA